MKSSSKYLELTDNKYLLQSSLVTDLKSKSCHILNIFIPLHKSKNWKYFSHNNHIVVENTSLNVWMNYTRLFLFNSGRSHVAVFRGGVGEEG